MPLVLLAMFLMLRRVPAQEGDLDHREPMWMHGIAAPAQEGDLAHTPQIWLQEITDVSPKTVQCRYDFQAFRKTTLDLLNKEPFTFLDLPGVASLVDVPWLTVEMSVADNSGQCT
ncbi:MAG TPA: hypothetical protein VKB68_04630, partial [Stellaceae bacterium]|nr:hypothetical protein [Stellaceae bacterium]